MLSLIHIYRQRDTIYLKTMGTRIKWTPNKIKVHCHTQPVHQSRGTRNPNVKPVPDIRRRSTFIATIESCINETYHDTIKLTPYETQFERRPTRVWERYINQEVSGDSISDNHQIFIKINMKRVKHANKMNEANKTTKFKIGDLVLIRTYCQSYAVQRKIVKFCELYCGPYKVRQVLGEATYCLLYTSRCV